MFVQHPGAIVTNVSEQSALLALTEAATAAKIRWYDVADLVEEAGSAIAVLSGSATFPEERDATLVRRLSAHASAEGADAWRVVLDRVMEAQTWLTTVLDAEYPVNLRRIYNRPPFLFIRGTLLAADERAVAVVGTRRPSPEGRAQARQLAAELARRGVTVVSGLAAGIDAEGHQAALEAGGRTLAVMGTGIDRVYPAENRDLAARIPAQGALISQFWPGAPPRAENFPLRNVVSSGIAMGTVVVEASGKSGARIQARLALEHGKRLFLVEPLVLQEAWARDFATRPGATVVKSVDDVLAVLEAEQVVQGAEQLSIF
ncbi:MAG: DNA-processing protein DprA [Actinomycetota bacterium]